MKRAFLVSSLMLFTVLGMHAASNSDDNVKLRLFNNFQKLEEAEKFDDFGKVEIGTDVLGALASLSLNDDKGQLAVDLLKSKAAKLVVDGWYMGTKADIPQNLIDLKNRLPELTNQMKQMAKQAEDTYSDYANVMDIDGEDVDD